MNSKIILADAFYDFKTENFENILSLFREGKASSLIYILPNARVLSKRLLELADYSKGIAQIKLYSFDTLVKENITIDKKLITEAEKILLLQEIIKNYSKIDELDYFEKVKDKQGFYEQMSAIITELKRNFIRPKELLKNSKAIIFQFAKIYDAYEKRLEELELIDMESVYIESLRELSQKEFLPGVKKIIIEGFFEFRPIERKLIEKMAKNNIEIVIQMPFLNNSEQKSIDKEIEPFLNSGFKLEKRESKILADEKSLNTIGAKSIYLEIESLIENIKRASQNYTAEDMKIVLYKDEYLYTLLRMGKLNGIPMEIRERIKLSEMPIVKELLQFLEIISGKINSKNLKSFVKLFYLNDLNIPLKHELERLLNSTEINSIEELKTELNRDIKLFEFCDEVMNEVLKLKELSEDIKKNRFELCEIFGLKQIRKRILNSFSKDENIEIFSKDMKVLDKIEEICTRISDSPLKFLLNGEMIIELFKNYCEEEEYIVWHNGGVRIFNSLEAAIEPSKLSFILGLDIDVPNIKNENFLINELYRKDLANSGFEFKTANENFHNELLKFDAIINNTSDKIYMSFSHSMSDKYNDYSILMEKALADFGKGEELDYINKSIVKENISKVSSVEELKLLLSYNLEDENLPYAAYLDNVAPDFFKKIYIDKSYNEQNNLEKLEESSFKDEIAYKYCEIYFKNRSYSATAFEDFRKCPYYFYAKNYLNLKTFDRLKRDDYYIQLGNLQHEILNAVYTNIKKYEMHKENLDFWISATVHFTKELFKKSLLSKHGYLLYYNILLDLINFVENDFERLKAMDFKYFPDQFEKEFRFNLSNDKDFVKIQGRIDRIDRGSDGSIVIDYKSNRAPIKSSLTNFSSLQMPIYQLALEDEFLAAIYGLIKPNEMVSFYYNKDKISLEEGSPFSDDEMKIFLENIKTEILKMYRAILDAKFYVNPFECKGKFCEYRDICRYRGRVK
ncbi:MAG: PD-(D/E)XK nuclease family protein [Tissierellia bacterium]|nr:PD-(D/E)XK nuclease family protein [Tissierellia bacterium]